MANIPLKTLKLHGLDDTYVIPSTPEEVGAAPIGLCKTIYTANSDAEDITQLNSILETMGDGEYGGQAVVYAICKRAYSIDQTPMHSWLYRIENIHNLYARVEATTSLGDGHKMQRVRFNGEWLPWEHISPPMLVNQEYRTTERWLDKPVYTKLVSYTPSSDIGKANGTHGFAITFSTPNFAQLVRYCGSINMENGNALPYFDAVGGYVGVNYMNNNGVAIALNNKIIPAGKTINVQVWYTKE